MPSSGDGFAELAKGGGEGVAVSSDEDLGGSLSALDRLCATAAELCGTEAAVIAYNRDGKTRILASHGIDKRFRIYHFELKGAPFKPKQFVVKGNAEKDPFFSELGAALGMPVCRLFIRAPISITKTHATSLIVLSGTTGDIPADDRLDVLRETAVLARDQLSPFFPLLDDDAQHVSVLTTTQSMIDAVTASREMTALVDDQLQVRAVSGPLVKAMRIDRSFIIGRPVTDIGLKSGTALAFLFRQALASGLSLPDLEVVSKNDKGGMEVFAVHATPLSPTDTPRSFLYVSVRDVTLLNHRETLINNRIRSKQRKPHHVEEPSLRFLLDTLVRRRTLRERNGISYLTIESWRQSIRTYQIAALKALKGKVPPEMSQAAASRIADEVGRVVGMGAFSFIVPVPCSNSGPDSCLSLEIARALGSITGLPVVQCLSLPPGGGSSHPKKNVHRPRMTLVEKIPGPALLVDDVATSGAHIEEATKLLRTCCNAVMGVAWIGA